MPYQPGKAKEATATTTVEFDGEPIEVTYRKRLVQSSLLNLLEDADDIQRAINVRRMLDEVVVSWDVTDEDGAMLPATPDVTRHFEFDFLMAVFNGIVQHATPGEDGGSISRTGSSTAATSARARMSTR